MLAALFQKTRMVTFCQSEHKKEREVEMTPSPQRCVRLFRSLPFNKDRLMEWVAYFYWFFTVLFLLFTELSLLYLAIMAPKALVFWRWIAQFQSIPPHIVSLPMDPSYFLWMPVLIVFVSGLPWFIYYFGKSAVIDFLEWRRFSHLRQLRLHQNIKQQLAYLYMFARSENERVQFLRQRRYQQAGDNLLFTFTAPINTIQPVGPFSWLYLRLSNYLFPPSFPAQARAIATYVRQVVDPGLAGTEDTEVDHTTLQASAEGDSQSQQVLPQAEQVEKKRHGCLYLFTPYPQLFLGENKQIPVRVKTLRLLELLAYLATHAKQHVHWDDIDARVYEWRYPEKNTHQRQAILHRDAAHLREILEAASQEAELPFVDPLPTEGRGRHAIWQLADAYEVVDLVALEAFYHQELEAIRKGQEIDLQRFRTFYGLVISYYQNGFLKGLLRKAEVGDWAKKLHGHYREKYWCILWEIAEYERTIGMRGQQEEQQDCCRRAAQLYERYALETAPMPQEAQIQEPHTHMSEDALQQSMRLYHRAEDDRAAYRVRHDYFKMMHRRFRGWTPRSQTEQVWREIMQEAGRA